MLLQITNINVNVTIGIYDWEKAIKRRLLLDLFFGINDSVAVSFLDYDAVLEVLKNDVLHLSFELIEDFVVFILELFKRVYPEVSYCKAIVKKMPICSLLPYAIIERHISNE